MQAGVRHECERGTAPEGPHSGAEPSCACSRSPSLGLSGHATSILCRGPFGHPVGRPLVPRETEPRIVQPRRLAVGAAPPPSEPRCPGRRSGTGRVPDPGFEGWREGGGEPRSELRSSTRRRPSGTPTIVDACLSGSARPRSTLPCEGSAGCRPGCSWEAPPLGWSGSSSRGRLADRHPGGAG